MKIQYMLGNFFLHRHVPPRAADKYAVKSMRYRVNNKPIYWQAAYSIKGQKFNIKIPFVKITVTRNGQVQTDISSNFYVTFKFKSDTSTSRLIDEYPNLSAPPTSDIVADELPIFVDSDYILVPNLKQIAARYSKIYFIVFKKKIKWWFWYQTPIGKIKL